MAKKDEAVITVKADTSQLDQAFEKAENAVKDLGTAGEESIGLLDSMTGGFASSLVKARAGIGAMIKGLGLTKVALISTGIGAFVVAIGSLVAYFTQTAAGAKMLEVALSGFQAVFRVIIDRIAQMGGAIVKLFKGDFKGAFDDASKALSGMGDEIAKEYNAMTELTKAAQELRKSQRDITVETAKQRAEIERLKMVSDDQTKSVKERIKAAQDAAALEKTLVAERVRIAEEEFRIEKARQATTFASEEDLMKLAQLEAEVFNIRQESTTLQTELQNKVNGLRQEGIRLAQEERTKEAEAKAAREKEAAEEAEMVAEANRKRIADERALAEELNQIGETDTERAVRQAEEVYAKRLELAGTNAELLKAVEEQFAADILAIEAKSQADRAAQDQAARDAKDAADAAARAEDLQAESDLQNAKKEMTANVMAAIDALAQLYNNGDEKRARRSFQISKALGIAAATMKTYEAVADALAKDAVPGVPGSRFAAAVAAGLTGLAQVAGIARQQFNPGGASAASAPSVTTPAPTPAPGFFPSTATDSSGFRAYVVGSELSNQMQASQRLKERVALFN